MKKPRTINVDLDEATAFILRHRGDDNIVVGPLVWKPSDGASSKVWYFTVATCDAKKQFRADQIVVEAPSDRDAIIVGLFAPRLRLIVHVTSDELYMAELCETIWPGTRISALCEQIKSERAAQDLNG